MFNLSKKSLSKLQGIHPDLVKVVRRAIQISEVDFAVGEGLRSIERQKELVKQGASKTMNSRHLTGHAIDLMALSNGKVVWDWPLYHKIADAMKRAAREVNVQIEWGGDWKTFKDGPHFQLPFAKYPKTQKFSALVDSAPEYSPETDTQAHTKAMASVGTGVASSTTVASEPILKAVEIVSQQQGELTSGDWLRIGVAGFILVVSVWYAWKKLK